VTEHDPFGGALSAGAPGGRSPGANGQPDANGPPDANGRPGAHRAAANRGGANGGSRHQVDDVEDFATDQDLEDVDRPGDGEDAQGAEGAGDLVNPGEAGYEAWYYEHAEGYDEHGAADQDEDVDEVQEVDELGGLGQSNDLEYTEDQYLGKAGEYYEFQPVDGDEPGLEDEAYVDGIGIGTAEDPPAISPADRRYTSRGGQSRRRRRRRRWTIGACAVAVAVVIVGVVGYVRVSHDINPGGGPGGAVTVAIPAGASTHKIADVLAKAGVIHGADVFELYTKLEGAGALLPGTYRLPTNEPYSSVLSTLENGPPPVTAKLVVPEGFTIHDIAAAVGRLPGIGISAPSFIQAATSGQVRSPYEPPGINDLEGLLFPATYPVEKGETADYLVQYMVDTFDSYASQLGLSAAAHALHYTPYQVVTVASIVEREAKFDSDRGPIASAIYNRLSRHMPIGAESTLLYALGDPKGPVNMGTRSPYNTLINVGLPPTPISNPGIPSLQAAMKPPTTSYIFWVEVNPDGRMGYASDEAGFAHLQAECKAAHLC
jgi:UPF0755 protein